MSRAASSSSWRERTLSDAMVTNRSVSSPLTISKPRARNTKEKLRRMLVRAIAIRVGSGLRSLRTDAKALVRRSTPRTCLIASSKSVRRTPIPRADNALCRDVEDMPVRTLRSMNGSARLADADSERVRLATGSYGFIRIETHINGVGPCPLRRLYESFTPMA